LSLTLLPPGSGDAPVVGYRRPALTLAGPPWQGRLQQVQKALLDRVHREIRHEMFW